MGQVKVFTTGFQILFFTLLWTVLIKYRPFRDFEQMFPHLRNDLSFLLSFLDSEGTRIKVNSAKYMYCSWEKHAHWVIILHFTLLFLLWYQCFLFQKIQKIWISFCNICDKDNFPLPHKLLWEGEREVLISSLWDSVTGCMGMVQNWIGGCSDWILESIS